MVGQPRFPRATPESQGVSSSAILHFLDQVARDQIELHSMMLVRHGHVVAEGWWSPYAPHEPHMLFSLSKSFTSSAIGMAAAEGLLTLTDPVLSFFPEENTDQARTHMQGLTVRNLLTMSTGHVEDTSPRLSALGGDNWVHGFFQCPVEKTPGSHFLYNNGATYMLSAIVQRVTGQTLLEYLTPRLFLPLGIEHPTWQTCPRGINLGNSGLKITTEDIAAFGQLYLQGGAWQGQQLLSPYWVEEATQAQVSNGSDPNDDWAQGYGYQFWRSRHGYRGDGAFGQCCFVLPDSDFVLALTAGMSDMGRVFNAVWETILPGLSAEPMAQSNHHDALGKRLTDLQITDLSPESVPSQWAGSLSGRVLTLDANPLNLHRIAFRQVDEQGIELVVSSDDEALASEIHSGFDAALGIQEMLIGSHGGAREPFQATACWTSPTTLEAALRFYQTPFCQYVRVDFSERTVLVDFWTNVRPDVVHHSYAEWQSEAL